MPRTRSRLSSSVTTSRVWPEEMQRRSAVSTSLGQVDRDDRRDRRHHLARLLLVQVKDAAEHAGLAGVELAARACLADQDAQLLGRRALFGGRLRIDPRSRKIALATMFNSEMKGFIPMLKAFSGRRDPDRDPVRVDDRVDLGDLLADDHVGGRDDDVGDRHRDAHLHAVGEAPEDRFEDRRDRRLAQEADAQRGQRDAELAGREVLVEVVMQLQRAARAGMAVLGHLLQRGAA